MLSKLDTVYSPALYLERDKKAFAFIEDRLLHQERCAAICMYGNGKDYLFLNVVKRFADSPLPHELKVLNTVSSDELRDFAEMLEREEQPTLCMVNLRIRQDVSWFIKDLERLRLKRGHAFLSFVCAYVGDVYQALVELESPLTNSLATLGLVSCEDAQNIIKLEYAPRFGFRPTDVQLQDIYRWTYGHVGLLRTLYLLKREDPDQQFAKQTLLAEPMVVERLHNILADLPPEKLQLITNKRLTFLDRMLFEKFGYINDQGELFHPLLQQLLSVQKMVVKPVGFSLTENNVLDYFRKHPNQVVSREDVATIIWGEEEWQDKYSDWAIGQLIYRLRKKLEYGSSSGTIETHKSRGFEFIPG
jgi:DNA-binding winged helix-turn-helix (wHTH) protein